MKRRGGSSLVGTLLLISICVGLAFTVVGLAFQHLNVSNRLANSQHARNLAESAISVTIEKILKAEGDYPRPGQDTVLVNFPDLGSDAFGVTSFNATIASQRGMTQSLNNLKKDTPVNSPGGRVVPKESVHIVALGSCRGVERRMEAILHIPIFQSAISAEAALDAQGPMLVASADSSTDDDVLTHPENYLSQLLPAHVTTNQDGVLGQDVLITGFCQAAGAIDIGSSNATVKGGIRPQDGRSEVPVLDVQDLDPALLGRTHGLENPSPGVFRADGGLIKMNNSVVGNELILPNGVNKSGAIVFVDGDIHVKEIRGVGAVVATGNISVTNSTNLSTDGTVAMLSGGNLSLAGQQEGADAIIKGIAYAGKSLAINNVTLVGTMVQAGSGAGDRLTVEKSNFIRTDDTVDFEFDMPFGVDAGQAGVSLKLDPKLSDFYDSASDSYAVDVNGDGNYTNPEDRPRRPVQAGNFTFYQGGNPISIPQVAALWVAEPVPPLGGGATWAAAGVNPVDEAQVEIYINQFVAGQVSRMNSELVNMEAFYQKFKLQPKGKGKISFDPTRFLTLSKAARIILWKDL